VKNGFVDPKRICIVGGSYGGYAALAGATLTPDLYACAISVNGVSDPEGMLKDAQRDGNNSPLAEWWASSMGADDMDHLRKISPLRHADAVLVPTLILHGAEDTVVPVEQSRAMNAKLLRAKKNVRYVELKGDDHWLSSASTRTQVLEEIDAFLTQSLVRAQ
jgi:dipeptidyl aminopeptidase/acylaminoacyl peptidase